jgi:hypothetical protein
MNKSSVIIDDLLSIEKKNKKNKTKQNRVDEAPSTPSIEK